MKQSIELAGISASARQSHQRLSDNFDDGLILLPRTSSIRVATGLECGLDPKTGENESNLPILILLARAAAHLPVNAQVDFDVENIVFILNSGADQLRLCWIEQGFQHNTPWSSVWNLYVVAIYPDVADVWERALKEVGLS